MVYLSLLLTMSYFMTYPGVTYPGVFW